MLNVSVGFDIKSLHVDAAGFGHLCEVVAHQVHQHPMLGSLFLVADHGFSEFEASSRVPPCGQVPLIGEVCRIPSRTMSKDSGDELASAMPRS